MSESQISDHAILLRVEPWIMRLEGLSIFEKLLLGYVFSWAVQHRCCFSSDEWLAHKFGVEKQDVFTTLNLLQMKGYIKINRAFQGGARALNFVFEEDIPDPCDGLTGPDDIFQID
jgi:hypothetical protein